MLYFEEQSYKAGRGIRVRFDWRLLVAEGVAYLFESESGAEIMHRSLGPTPAARRPRKLDGSATEQLESLVQWSPSSASHASVDRTENNAIVDARRWH
jgi:hypothetical protein